MSNTYQLIVDAVYKGGGAFQQARGDLSGLDNAAKGVGAGVSGSLAKVGIAFGAVSLAVAGVAAAAGKAYSVLREGAALVTTQQRFDKLSASIGTTADTLLGKLRTATKGMISDMELMSSASGIISLRLAENEDQVIRLATVVGTLGWDMQQVILTFANLSTMRLDALGLSVTEVKNKQKELMQEGMSEIEAFKEAVIQAGEARLEVGGVSEAEQSFKQFETAITNTRNELSLVAVELAKNIGLIEGMGKAASRLSLLRELSDVDAKAREMGVAFENSGSAALRSFQLSQMSTAELARELERMQGKIENSDTAWFYMGDVATMINADVRNEVIETATVIGVAIDRLMTMSADAEKLASAGYMAQARMPAQAMTNRYAGWIASTNARNRAAEEERASLLASEQAVYSYGGALSVVDQREQSLIATHSRMAAAFSSEAFSDAADGLINADGTANAEALSTALYDQAKAAGATAGQLALLGVATGALTEDQARAALKAAVLTEQARKLAMAVVAGQMGFGEAAAGMITFGAELDTQAAGQSLETLATAADGFAESVYEAELAVDNEAANLGLTASIDLINEFEGTHVANMVTTYSTTGGTSSPTGGGPMGGTSGAAGGNGTTTNSLEDDGKSRRYGRSATRNAGADLLPYGGGSVYPDRRSAEVYTNYHGGSTVNVTVTNYVDGRQVGRDNLDDITEDSIKRAMNELGLGRR